MPRILILDANQRSALACMRSLGRMDGLELLAADSLPSALAGQSRFCRGYSQHPSVRETPDAFIDWLVDCQQREGIDLLFPMTEFTSQLILMHNQRHPEAALALPFADAERLLSLGDKGRLVERAGRLGIAVPESRLYARAAEVDTASIGDYPVVIKPCRSHLWLGDRWLTTSVQIARDRAELETCLATSPWLQDHDFMLQRFITGHGGGVFALYNRGQAVCFFAHRRLREKPPQGGVSVLSESVVPDPRMQQAARELLDDAGWHGVAMVEFRIDESGKAWLMEVNTRFWGSLQLAIDAGVDFPQLLYRATRGEPLPEMSGYRTGQRLRWLLGDLDSLYLVLRDRRYGIGDKLRRLLAFFTPHPFSTRHEVNRWSDPMPAWAELKQYIADLRR